MSDFLGSGTPSGGRPTPEGDPRVGAGALTAHAPGTTPPRADAPHAYSAPPGYGAPPGYNPPPVYGSVPSYGAPPGYGAPGWPYGAPGWPYGVPGGFGSPPAPRSGLPAWRIALIVVGAVLGPVLAVAIAVPVVLQARTRHVGLAFPDRLAGMERVDVDSPGMTNFRRLENSATVDEVGAMAYRTMGEARYASVLALTTTERHSDAHFRRYADQLMSGDSEQIRRIVLTPRPAGRRGGTLVCGADESITICIAWDDMWFMATAVPDYVQDPVEFTRQARDTVIDED